MRVSFVVPTYRRPDALEATLEALVRLDYPPSLYEVVVVDDGSADSTAEVTARFRHAGPAILYVQQANSGVATARNNGAERAHGELLIFLDDDMLVAPDHITAHLAVREAHGDCLVNGHWAFSDATRAALAETPFGRYRMELEDDIRDRIAKEPLGDGRMRPAEVTAANLGISAVRFRELGGFDGDFPYAGYEDQDFSLRARRAGCLFVYDPAIRLLHNDGRVTLQQFCRRQERGAVTAVFLVARHPQEYADHPMLLENQPVTPYDPWRWRVKKACKRAYASRPGLWLAGMAVRSVERRYPDSRLLRKLYSMTLGAFLFRGIRQGLRAAPEARAATRAAMRERFGDA